MLDPMELRHERLRAARLYFVCDRAPGRRPLRDVLPAAGIEYVRHAAEQAGEVPWFAIGGIDATNVGEIVAAGARRIVVVRAIAEAADPEQAARTLRAAVETEALVGTP